MASQGRLRLGVLYLLFSWLVLKSRRAIGGVLLLFLSSGFLNLQRGIVLIDYRFLFFLALLMAIPACKFSLHH
jgi:hypothetical protein